MKRPFSLKSFLIREGLTWGLGLVLGLGLTSLMLWDRAQRDIAAYSAAPPRPAPGLIFSDAIHLHAGQRARLSEVAGDLLSTGYEHSARLDGPGQFSTGGDTLRIWLLDADRAGQPERVQLRFTDGTINSTKPKRGLTLPPTLLAAIGDKGEARDTIILSEVSRWLEPAIVSMEDARFRDHHGIDPIGILRAIVHNLSGRGGMHGGSTLTQQLSKNLFLSSERSLQRKVREAFFAAALEYSRDKDTLLQMYMSEIYLGQMGGVPIHGVEQASRAWFGLSAKRLSLGQAALIGGVISAPNRYSPTRHPERAFKRRDLVLKRMVATGAITEAERQDAQTESLEINGTLPGAVRRAPWAVDVAIDEIEEALGHQALRHSGFQLHTTIQPVLQRAAQRAVIDGLAELSERYPKAAGAQAALVALRVSDGAVVAIVGGKNYADSPFNRATDAWRQAGSTVKPFTYLTAFDSDRSLSPIDTLDDAQHTVRYGGSTWTPNNYDHRFVGPITLRRALESSRNIPAVLLAERVGFPELHQQLLRSGLSRSSSLPSTSLGAFQTTTWEMAGAYSTFATGGDHREPWLVRSLADQNAIELAHFSGKSTPVATSRATALTTALLQGVITDGTGRRAASYGVKIPAGGKTGTTNEGRDAWFVGFTTDLIVAVWVGNDRGTLGLGGGQAALPIWSKFIVSAAPKDRNFTLPRDVITLPVCADSLQLARKSCPITYDEVFSKNGQPDHRCDEHQSPVIKAGRTFSDLLRNPFGRGRD